MENTKMTDGLKKWRKENPEGASHGPAKNPAQKWLDKDTRGTAINAKCWDCSGGGLTADESAGVRGLIADCPCGPDHPQPCPLYAWRPYKK